jgi:hypothetical protein
MARVAEQTESRKGDRLILPNFLVLGAPRCGTTSLYHYLKQHPQVYMSPVKEPHFFSSFNAEPSAANGHRATQSATLEEYATLFDGVTNEIAIGEASTHYLASKRAPANIQQYIPHVKLVAILRDPAERAYSAFLKNAREGHEPARTIEQAIREEKNGMRYGARFGNYLNTGLYFAKLQPYLQRFKREQLLILLFDDLKVKPRLLMRDLYQFLGVDDSFTPDLSPRYNLSGTPRHSGWHKWLENPSRFIAACAALVPPAPRHRLKYLLLKQNLDKPAPLTAEARQELIEYYRQDILALQDLIQRDLSHWLA